MPELRPFHTICTRMARRINAERRVRMLVPDLPSLRTNRSCVPVTHHHQKANEQHACERSQEVEWIAVFKARTRLIS
jgi:hypothetical protein